MRLEFVAIQIAQQGLNSSHTAVDTHVGERFAIRPKLSAQQSGTGTHFGIRVVDTQVEVTRQRCDASVKLSRFIQYTTLHRGDVHGCEERFLGFGHLLHQTVQVIIGTAVSKVAANLIETFMELFNVQSQRQF